jgi:hypothetical protein
MSGKRNYVWNGETFVDVTGWVRPKPKFPAIHRDNMDALVHPATGKVFDSKSRFREVTKAHGLTEVGNDYRNNQKPSVEPKDARKKVIAEAITALEQGYTPPPNETLSDWGETRMLGTV